MPATKLSKPVIGGLVALLAILLAGAWLIHVYVAKERQRDLDDWAIRLGLIAETRVSAIEDKLSEQVEALSELAASIREHALIQPLVVSNSVRGVLV